MPCYTSGYRIKEVLQNAALADATAPTIVFKTRSLVPFAFLVTLEVSFLRAIATTKDDTTAPEYPLSKSSFENIL